MFPISTGSNHLNLSRIHKASILNESGAGFSALDKSYNPENSLMVGQENDMGAAMDGKADDSIVYLNTSQQSDPFNDLGQPEILLEDIDQT